MPGVCNAFHRLANCKLKGNIESTYKPGHVAFNLNHEAQGFGAPKLKGKNEGWDLDSPKSDSLLTTGHRKLAG
ncbi:hypothetical protein FRC03_003006 [Tulasnella sp. 419]|nr:hypothetical protein FRC02_006752 [Tulasnella sp. 418]KAG8963417.1 hypothetical protein FRC03_003006 [Tulasnella sp. 419]